MAQFIPGGPKRYPHQTRGLKKLIETAGVGALLFDPGLGKTATALDFMSILALKAPLNDQGVREARVLVIAPLAAVDTWVKEAPKWVSPQVNFWAEALSGSIVKRAAALAARGGQPFGPKTMETLTGTKPRKQYRTIAGVKQEVPVRAWGWEKSIDQSARGDRERILPSDGPDGTGTSKPRLIIEVLNFDTFASRQRIGSKLVSDVVLEGVKRYAPDLVLLDESHKIKSASSNVSRLMDRIGQNAKRKILLTGTVMPSGPLDVFGQWRFLDPYAFGELQADGTVKRMTLDSFKRRFAVMGGYMGHQVVGYRNLDELQNIMAKRATVARKEDELDLPPVFKKVVPVMLSAKEKQAYQDMKKDLATNLWGASTSSADNRLTQMMRLRQITSGHLPDDNGNVVKIGASKVNTIRSIVQDELQGRERVVVYCLFRQEYEDLKAALETEAGTIVLGVNGDTPNQTRLAYRKQFGNRDDHRRMVFLAQIKTMSIAVNELVTASEVVFGSLSQQRDDLIQAIDRLNRIGQQGESVTVYFAEAPGTIDTVIHASHDDRTNLENAVLQHILGDDYAEFDAKQAKPEQAMSDEGSTDTHSHAEAVEVTEDLERDPRFPDVSSMTPEQVRDAVGDWHGEDEVPVSRGASTFNVVDASEGRPAWTDAGSTQ